MSSPVAELLADLAPALGRLRVRWYVFGAQAAISYGAVRVTGDVDVTVELGFVSASILVRKLARTFSLRVSDRTDFVERTRVIPLVHRRSGMPLDVVLAGPGPEEHFLDRARPRLIGGVRVPVAGAEDVIAMKILAGRPQDLQDVDAILRANRGELELSLVRTTLSLLERALDQSDLIPALDRAVARTRRLRRGPRTRPTAGKPSGRRRK